MNKRSKWSWSKDNTCVTYDPTNNMSAEVFLHGNHIATVTDNDLTYILVVVGLLTPLSLDSMHLSKNFLSKVEFFKRTLTGMLNV